jgi:hypothetical protein
MLTRATSEDGDVSEVEGDEDVVSGAVVGEMETGLRRKEGGGG